MTQLNDFISQVKTSGLARNNRYSVIITPPLGLQLPQTKTMDLQSMLLFCDQIQVPGLNISTTQNRTFGEFREVPYEKLFGDVNISFYVDSGMYVKEFFDKWTQIIQNPYTRTFNYYKNYTTNMTINIEDVEDRKRYTVALYECYPKTISPLQMDYSSKDVMKFQVTMQYKYWLSSSREVTSNYRETIAPKGSDINPSVQGWNYMVPESYYNDFDNFQTQYNEQGYDALIDRIIRSA